MLPPPGPPRTMLTNTAGSSEQAIVEMNSCIFAMPGPDEEVMTLSPVAAPPNTIALEASSLSACMNTPPRSQMCSDIYSPISDCGVMG